jgi:hypothetical protein
MFLELTSMVKEFWEDLEIRRATPHQNEGGLVETMVKTEADRGGEGEEPPGYPSSPSLSSSSSLSSSCDGSKRSSHKRKKRSKKSSCSHDPPLLNLDVKLNLSTYDGELNAEKLDNWVKQIEVYCRVHKITHDTSKIQLATLRLSGTTLIRWESQTHVDLIQHGKIISSWTEFIVALRKQFYTLAYMQHINGFLATTETRKREKCSSLYT